MVGDAFGQHPTATLKPFANRFGIAVPKMSDDHEQDHQNGTLRQRTGYPDRLMIETTMLREVPPPQSPMPLPPPSWFSFGRFSSLLCSSQRPFALYEPAAISLWLP